MTISASSIASRVRDILQDTAGVRWTDAELIRWFNSGQREIVMLRPDAKTANSSVQLVEGSKQSIPSGGLKFIEATRNMGADGSTEGRVIRTIPREVLDAQDPNWHTAANASGVIKHVMFDVRDPRNFYVYPPVPASPNVYIEEIYSVAPTDISALAGENMNLDDIYEGALINYILFRCYSKQSEGVTNDRLAANYYQYFIASLGVKTKVDITVSPNMNSRPMAARGTTGMNTPGVT
jgi:hypothetical protein